MNHYQQYYQAQAGAGINTYHQGPEFQRGHGLGGLFRTLAKSALPLLKQGAAYLTRRALNATADMTDDVLKDGTNIRHAAKKRYGALVGLGHKKKPKKRGLSKPRGRPPKKQKCNILN